MQVIVLRGQVRGCYSLQLQEIDSGIDSYKKLLSFIISSYIIMEIEVYWPLERLSNVALLVNFLKLIFLLLLVYFRLSFRPACNNFHYFHICLSFLYRYRFCFFFLLIFLSFICFLYTKAYLSLSSQFTPEHTPRRVSYCIV